LVKSVIILHAASKEEAMEEKFSLSIRNAHGVWFEGGDQNRLSMLYVDSPVEKALIDLLQRGGVVGGTSAGAAIQSRCMIAGGKGTPRLGRGFPLFPGVVDMHFLERNREGRLLEAMKLSGSNTGLGVDKFGAVVWPLKNGASTAY
jgi:cyanophycinase